MHNYRRRRDYCDNTFPASVMDCDAKGELHPGLKFQFYAMLVRFNQLLGILRGNRFLAESFRFVLAPVKVNNEAKTSFDG